MPTDVPLTGSLCRCSVCRRTFANVTDFDAHRPDRGGCGDPTEIGLVEHAGVWGTPEGHAYRSQFAERMRTARRSGRQSDEQGAPLPEVPHG